jgi:hypothetical protein
MQLNGLDSVIRTMRKVATPWTDQESNRQLISPDQANEHAGDDPIHVAEP